LNSNYWNSNYCQLLRDQNYCVFSVHRALQYCYETIQYWYGHFNVDFRDNHDYQQLRKAKTDTLLELTDRTITAWRQKMGLPPRPPLATQTLQPALTEMSQTS